MTSRTFKNSAALALASSLALAAVPPCSAEPAQPAAVETAKAPAAAAQAGQSVRPDQARAVLQNLFSALDCDMAGDIDAGEVDDHFGQVWLPVDRDRSRLLDRSEYSRVHHAIPAADSRALFADADRNGDDGIDHNEYRAHLQRLLEVLDADANGSVTREEAGFADTRNVLPDFQTAEEKSADAGG